jgi:hypothetical protein
MIEKRQSFICRDDVEAVYVSRDDEVEKYLNRDDGEEENIHKYIEMM